MVEIEKKEVALSEVFDKDLIQVFEYGEETFGFTAAKIFIGEIYNYVWNLDSMYLSHPECRFLKTKNKIYRNIILGSYIIIYRITPARVEVLRIFNSRISIRKIRTVRKSTV